MDVFKTKPFIKQEIPINEENYTEYTHKAKPYYVETSDNKHKCYAVCPACDNPILIVGLYKQEKDSEPNKPYGRHNKGDVYRIAQYNEEAYYNCPYAKISQGEQRKKRPEGNAKSNALLDYLNNNMESIIARLSDSLGILISDAFKDKLYNNFVSNEGWKYYDVSFENLYMMLLYAEPAYTLFGRKVIVDSPLYEALLPLDYIELEETSDPRYVKVTSEGFLDMSFVITNHRRNVVEEHLTETFTMTVYHDGETIFTRIIEI